MPSEDAKTWRRRERALGIGLGLWTAGVTLALVIEPNTDSLTLLFVFLIMFLPITLHTLFGEDRHVDTERDRDE